MAPNAYQKFSIHATLHLRASRHTWTSAERRDTILTVYHGNPTVRQHYATNTTEIPALYTLFPDVAYTRENVIEARSHRCLPGDLASVQVPPAPVAIPQAEPAQAAQVILQAPSQAGAPYEFWPPLPWPYEPDLPIVGAGTVSLRNKDIFMSTKPHMLDEEPRWHGAKFLGSGSSGVAGLWCQVDEHGNVVDRMVVKDNVSFPLKAWRDPKNWRDRLPREIAIHRRVESRRTIDPDACSNLVRYRGHRLLMSKRRFRLYTDYASGGDLQAAMESSYHQKWTDIHPRDVATQDCVPEAFIWHTIKALATACLVLQNGTLSDEPVAGWNPIMHLDLQLPNILLDTQSKKRKAPAAEPDSAPANPSKRPKPSAPATSHEDKETIPLLTDFGLSTFNLDFTHCPSLSENPTAHILPFGHGGTRYAPEHNHLSLPSPDPLSSATTVWSIGAVAYALIANIPTPAGPVREYGPLDEVTGAPLPLSRWQAENLQLRDRYDEEVLVGSPDVPAAGRYSEELKGLVRECLAFLPEGRVGLGEVLARARAHLDARPEVGAGAMDVGNTGFEAQDDGGFGVGEPLVVARAGV